MIFDGLKAELNKSYTDKEIELGLGLIFASSLVAGAAYSGAKHLYKSACPKTTGMAAIGASVLCAAASVKTVDILSNAASGYVEKHIEDNAKDYPHFYEHLSGKPICGRYAWGKEETKE